MKHEDYREMSTTEVNKEARLEKPDHLKEFYKKTKNYNENTGSSEWLADLIERRDCALLK